MADKKISALTASSTPLAGTEVLPIVQSGATVKVSVADLTAGRSFDALGMILTSTDAGVAAAPTLDLYRDSASPAASDTLGEIKFNGEDSAGNKQQYALIHAAIISPTSTSEGGQLHFETTTLGSSTEKMRIGTSGDVTLLTGNLVIGTSGKGIDFSATSGTGTSELFNDYEIGTFTPTWTPATGSGATVNNASGWYTKVGNRITVDVYIGTNGHGTSAGNVTIGALPFTSSANSNQNGGFYLVQAANSGLGIGQMVAGRIVFNTATFSPIAWNSTGGGTSTMTAAEWGVSGLYRFTGSYETV